MSNRKDNLGTPFTFQFAVTAAGTPERLTIKKRATTIAFNENTEAADTITDSASGFLTAGFQAGDVITVSGSASNNGDYVIDAVVAGTITLRGPGDLTTEAAGATVKITAPKTISDGVDLIVKAKYANTGVIHISDTTEKALNTSGGSFSLRANETAALQIENTQNLWIDATVSGEGVEVIFEKNAQA